MMDVKIEGALSPFLDGTNIQFAWDSTSLGWAKACPRLYYYNMICSYRPKSESIHLRFGQEYHTALQQYDIARAHGLSHDQAEHEAVAQLVRRLKDYQDPVDGPKSVRPKTKANLIRTVVWYLEQFENDPAQTMILKDGKPAVELSFRFQLDFGPEAGQPYLLCGHLDRVVNFNDEIFVMDRKTTTKTPNTYYFNQYEPDNQMTLYTIAGRIILKSPIRGVVIDVAQVAQDFSRFTRGITYRTPDQLEEWMEDLSHHLRIMEKYATEDYWPQNDTACDKFGGCRFREICSKSPGVRENYLETDYITNPWNPLEVR